MFRPNPRHCALHLFWLWLLCATPAALAAPFQGQILKSEGQISVLDASGSAVDLQQAGNLVREAQTITTGPDGRAVVSFNNGTITVLDPNSRLRVRTPNWFVHLAGKAFFAFKKLVGQEDARRVQNTVALIGIRGTEFLSYEGETTAVALDEGQLNLQTLGDAFQLSEDGAAEDVGEFLLDEKEMVTFDGTAASVGPFSPQVLADLAAIRVFGGALLSNFTVDYTPDVTAGAAGAEGAVVAVPPGEAEQEAATEAAAASAREDDGGIGFYFGAGAGISRNDTGSGEIAQRLRDRGQNFNSVNFDDESQAVRLFGGYYFTDNLGVELGYVDLGEFTSEIALDPSDANQAFADAVAEVHPVSASGAYAAGVIRLNLLLFALHAKAGVFAWEGEVEASLPSGLSADTSRDGTDTVIGAGVDFSIGPLGLRAEVEHFELDEDTVDVISANLVFGF